MLVKPKRLKLDIHTEPDVFDRLSEWWNSQQGPQWSPFLRSEWFKVWARTRLSDRDELEVFVVRDGSAPRAALPMVRRGARLVSLSSGVSNVFDIVHEGDLEAVDVILGALQRETRVLFDRVDGRSPLAAAVPHFPRWQIQRHLLSPYVDLSAGIEPILGDVSKSLTRNIRRGLGRLEAVGTVEVVPRVSSSELAQRLDEAIALEASGWKGAAGVAVANSPGKVRFFRLITDVAEEHDWLRLAVLTVDGRVVGFNYDLEYNGRLFGLFTSYDETMDSRSSIGAVLFSKLLEHAVERGVKSYDMGGDSSNEWKMMWTAQTRDRVDITGFGSNPFGRLASGFSRSRRALTSA